MSDTMADVGSKLRKDKSLRYDMTTGEYNYSPNSAMTYANQTIEEAARRMRNSYKSQPVDQSKYEKAISSLTAEAKIRYASLTPDQKRRISEDDFVRAAIKDEMSRLGVYGGY